MKKLILITILFFSFVADATKSENTALIEKIFAKILIRFDGKLTPLVEEGEDFGVDESYDEAKTSCYSLSSPKEQKFANTNSGIFCDGCFGTPNCNVQDNHYRAHGLIKIMKASGLPFELFKKIPTVLVNNEPAYFKRGKVNSFAEKYYLPAVTIQSGKLVRKVFECNLTYGVSLAINFNSENKPRYRSSKFEIMLVCPKFDIKQHEIFDYIINQNLEIVGNVNWKLRESGFDNYLETFNVYFPAQHETMGEIKKTTTFSADPNVKVSRSGLRSFKKLFGIDDVCRAGPNQGEYVSTLSFFNCQDEAFVDLTDKSIVKDITYRTHSEFANGIIQFKALPVDRNPCSVTLRQGNKTVLDLQFESSTESKICFKKISDNRSKEEATAIYKLSKPVLDKTIQKDKIRINTQALLNPKYCNGLWGQCGVFERPKFKFSPLDSENSQGYRSYSGLYVIDDNIKKFLYRQGLGCESFKFFGNNTNKNMCFQPSGKKIFGIGQLYESNINHDSTLEFKLDYKSLNLGEMFYALDYSYYGNSRFYRCLSISKLSKNEYLLLCGKQAYLAQNENYIRSDITPINFHNKTSKKIKEFKNLTLSRKEVDGVNWSYVTRIDKPSIVGMLLPLSKYLPVEFSKPDWMSKQGYANMQFSILFTKNSDIKGSTSIKEKSLKTMRKLLQLEFNDEMNIWYLPTKQFIKILSSNKIKKSKEKIQWLLDGINTCSGGRAFTKNSQLPECYKLIENRL